MKELKQIRILVLTTFFEPHRGGVETYVKNLFGSLVKLPGVEYHVDVVACNTEKTKTYQYLDGLHVHRVKCINMFESSVPFPGSVFKLLKKLHKKNNYQIVSTQTRFFMLSFLGAYFARKHRIVHIHTEHGGAPLTRSDIVIKTLASIFDATLGKYVVSKADHVTGVSKKSVAFARSLGAKTCSVIYNGINPKDFSSLRSDSQNRKKKSILFVGRLVQAKGVQDLLVAFSKIKDRNAVLQIVGDGPDRKLFEKQAKELGLSSRVSFLGSKAPAEAKKLLAASDVFVNPSYNEGLPTTVLEAGFLGIPTIATDVGGTAEIIESSEMGYLIRPKSPKSIAVALDTVLSSYPKARKQAAVLRKQVKEKFTWPSIAKNYHNLCTTILRSK